MSPMYYKFTTVSITLFIIVITTYVTLLLHMLLLLFAVMSCVNSAMTMSYSNM